MDKYTGIYATSGAVQSAVEEELLHKPYMAIVQDDPQYIDWNSLSPQPIYSAIPMTMEFLSAGTIVWQKTGNPSSGDVIQYRINGTGGWQSITAQAGNASTIQVNAGDKVEFQGGVNPLAADHIPAYADNASNLHTLKSTAPHILYGNLMSMIEGVNRLANTTLYSAFTFYGFFANNSGLQSAKNLYMPATNVRAYGYNRMFNNCINLVEAPELPNINLSYDGTNGGRQLERMFYGCSKLNYVKCLITDPEPVNSTYATFNWLSNVAQSGTFVKHPDATWGRKVSGIPLGWTVLDAS